MRFGENANDGWGTCVLNRRFGGNSSKGCPLCWKDALQEYVDWTDAFDAARPVLGGKRKRVGVRVY